MSSVVVVCHMRVLSVVYCALFVVGVCCLTLVVVCCVLFDACGSFFVVC